MEDFPAFPALSDFSGAEGEAEPSVAPPGRVPPGPSSTVLPAPPCWDSKPVGVPPACTLSEPPPIVN